MRPLPSVPYEPAVWTPELRVGQDYLVSDGKNKYSVPFDLIGEKVTLRLTGQTVEVFYRGTRVAMHRRSCTAQRDPIVKMEHMPPEHRRYLSYSTPSSAPSTTPANGTSESIPVPRRPVPSLRLLWIVSSITPIISSLMARSPCENATASKVWRHDHRVLPEPSMTNPDSSWIPPLHHG